MRKLTQAEAIQRAARVSQLRYHLSFQIDAQEPDFTGEVRIAFALKEDSSPLTLDFLGGTVETLRINDQGIASPAYNGSVLTLPAASLKPGENQVLIRFRHPYSQTGNGLYRIKDQEDGHAYLYTDFEPFDANQAFPCFDQPDLKARYTLTVEAPAGWTVVSTVREKEITPIEGERARWSFPETPPLSTYLFSLHAGPYRIWESHSGKIPLRLFARQALAKYVDAKEWFRVTDQAFGFYQDYFDLPYPFEKYDQLIVPDFNSGAMENVAAVTFSERYIRRGQSTLDEREARASVILHEMAHMWFGNLVTMRWWNDLWLNESFASYMEALCMAEATDFKKSWQSFFRGFKQWAYWEDELVTTHPIEGDAPDTDQAFVNFDGITYGKGASVLKQLAFYLGKDQFREGVRNYLKRFAFQNAELKDFIGALEKAARLDLSPWTGQWLRTQGLNTVQVEYRCRDGKIEAFHLVQKTNGSSLRTHRTQVGLYALSEGSVQPFQVAPVTYSGERTEVSGLKDAPCPLMVYANHGDFDYAKIKLDARSIEAVKGNLSKIADPLLRTMVWQSLWDMVRDYELPLMEYNELALQNLPAEEDVQLLSTLGGRIYGGRGQSPSVLFYLPRGDRKVEVLRNRMIGQWERLFWSHLQKAEPGSDFQKFWLDGYLLLSRSAEAQRNLLQLLNGETRLPGLELDQDRRWGLVWQLSALDHAQAELLRQAELKQDPSETGQKMAIAAEAASPSLEIKRKWLQEITHSQSSLSLAKLKAAMGSLYPVDQVSFRGQLGEIFFEHLPRLAGEKENEFLRAYTESLVPSLGTPESVSRLEGFIAANPTLPPIVLKKLKVARQEDERCRVIRELVREAIEIM